MLALEVVSATGTARGSMAVTVPTLRAALRPSARNVFPTRADIDSPATIHIPTSEPLQGRKTETSLKDLCMSFH